MKKKNNSQFSTLHSPLVPPGYKQTEVGVIPEDWALEYIEDFAHITTGGKNTQDRVEDGQYPFFVRSQTVERINSYSFDGEAVLTAGDGVGTGKVFHYIKGRFDVHQRVYQISNFAERVSGYFFYLYFSTHFYNRIMQMTAKSSVDSVRRDMIARMRVPLPPTFEEQRAIAAALSDVDALLDGLDRLIAKKRDLKQAAMQALLSPPATTAMENGKLRMENEDSSINSQFTTLNSPLNIRLPGFDGEWELVRAGDIGQFRGGSGFPIKFQGETSGTYPFFKVSDMNNEGNEIFMVSANNYINESVRKQIGSIVFPAQTIVFAKIGAAIFLERKKILCVPSCIDNNMSGYIIDATRGDVYFIHYVLLRRKFGESVSTTALPFLSGSVLASIEFFLPPLKEQTAIAAVLSDMDAEIVALEQRRNKTRDLKQAMMQELLTGKTRLI